MSLNALHAFHSWFETHREFPLVLGVLDWILEAGGVNLDEEMPIKKRRMVYARQGDYWSTSWGRMLLDPQSKIEGTRAFKTFRRRFRMPADLFIDTFIPRVKAVNLFETERQSAIPVEIKCMIGLRILGRGSCADDMSELSGVGESTCNAIFHDFIHGMVKHFFTEVVKPPTGADLDLVLQTYARLGYPGAVGSIDCTHIYWGKCPVEMTHLCRGKEKSPTLSFEVVVDHAGFIHSCTKGFVGTCADKMIVVNDPYAKAIAEGLYKDVKYSLYDADGKFTTYSGCYLLSDCGYTRYWMFQMPLANVHDDRSVYWSEFLESVRKDVERTFGILKARFLFLAGKVQYHKHTTITAAMRCACILHNWLLERDRRPVWTGMDPDADPVEGAEDADPEQNNDIEPAIDLEDPAPAALQLHTGLGVVPHTRGARVMHYSHHAHHALQEALITHFEYSYRRGCIVWPRGFTPQQRAIFPMQQPNIQSNVLYTAPSWYMAQNAAGEYTTHIGTGLYSCIRLSAGQRLLRFSGVVRTYPEYNARVAAGMGGYALHLNNDTVLDCYDNRSTCYASMANSPRSVRTTRQGLVQAPIANCEIKVGNAALGIIHLVTKFAIQAHVELFTDYGPAYVYPAPALV